MGLLTHGKSFFGLYKEDGRPPHSLTLSFFHFSSLSLSLTLSSKERKKEKKEEEEGEEGTATRGFRGKVLISFLLPYCLFILLRYSLICCFVDGLVGGTS